MSQTHQQTSFALPITSKQTHARLRLRPHPHRTTTGSQISFMHFTRYLNKPSLFFFLEKKTQEKNHLLASYSPTYLPICLSVY